ncbi:hypothetical protein NC652_028692 [Populus alba x Populus x berolinensis]|uniref:Uncharacterized protein n=1 Tax=Populus alba x Populus x berolinensis TaxID=444605 RepID=A0AAD6Q4Z7_9ROSI|nr:hypothetical protein NC652_027822 [Populus alba x Populus x berolinensis]KAJ6895018.1 hypothetical protein NC652_028689 [Populus alba x Populus x berolinensis]KAJ6895022.1 hypothetical protein NC652_028692 [Populus alba x Populus x berolinensis]KAJ6979434.1 hypothetical protein NC653_027547 [Populus alba x Populus x berolinensis]
MLDMPWIKSDCAVDTLLTSMGASKEFASCWLECWLPFKNLTRSWEDYWL